MGLAKLRAELAELERLVEREQHEMNIAFLRGATITRVGMLIAYASIGSLAGYLMIVA